jgi:DNA gyrase subunit A
MRTRFGVPRLTDIEESDAEEFDMGELIAEHDVAVTISHRGYVKRLPIDTYREQRRGGRGIKGTTAQDDDFVEQLFVASTHDDLLCFTNTGRVYKIKVYQIPETSRTARGRAIVNLLDLKAEERIVAFLTIQDFEKSEDYLFFAASSGKVKRTSLKDFRNIHKSGIIAVSLNEGDRLIDVIYTTGNNNVLLATADGMSIRFDEDDVRIMGRNAAGVKGINLGEDDEVVGLIRVDDEEADLLTVTENGYGKRTQLSEYLVQSDDGSSRTQSRGGKGRIDIRANDRNGKVVCIRLVLDTYGVVFISEKGMIVRVPVASISRIGRNTQGVRLVNLKDGDRLIAAATITEPESDEDGVEGIDDAGDLANETAE